MWHYIKSAFFVRPKVPGIGPVPVNVLLTAGFGILGFAQPAFWLLGMAVEAVVVPGLAFNPRFQKYVEGLQLQSAKDDDDARRQALVQLLNLDDRQRLGVLASKCNQILDVFRSQQAEDYILDTNAHALDTLRWVYLKLLVARHHLLSPAYNETESSLEQKIAAIDRELADASEAESLRQSKAATQAILKKRLTNIHLRQQTLEEINSDMTRIEAQVDLILENATMQTKPQTISADIELASDLLGAGVFGEDEVAVTALDRKYSAPRTPLKETS